MRVMKYKFDSKRDVMEVSQTGFLDLVDAFKHNAIPSDLEAADLSYNGISEPSSISGRPRDVFDEIAARESFRKYAAEYSKRAEK